MWNYVRDWAVCRRFTEADLRLYPTIVRFDAAYATLFKCCRRRIADYPNLSAWLRDVYQLNVGAASPVQARRRGAVLRMRVSSV